MATGRIQFKTPSQDWSDAYALPINPVSWDENATSNPNVKKTVDGNPVVSYPAFDQNVKKFLWINLPNKAPYSTMISQLKSYEGLSRVNMRLNSLNSGSDVSMDIMIVSVTYELLDGAGPQSADYYLKYKRVVVEYVELIPT